jgi:large subunit ribosomal protein L25
VRRFLFATRQYYRLANSLPVSPGQVIQGEKKIMEALELKGEVREVTGRHVKQLREAGLVPAVLYGRDIKPVSIQIHEKPLAKALRQAGTHQLISLQVGNNQPVLTLARDIQRDVMKHSYLHVDFYAVKMSEKVTARIPLIFVGDAPAVDEMGGILTHGLDEVEVECLPADLIPSIAVSLASLVHLNDSISVADLQVPPAVSILSDPESMVAKVEPPRAAETLEEEAVEVSAEPEVVGRGREKVEEEE